MKNYPALFNDQSIPLSKDIAVHAKAIIEGIYHTKYMKADPVDEIARYHHGAQHISRAAIIARCMTQLFQNFGDSDALSLTEDKIKMLEIAVLLHDSARENDAVDLWDLDSGEIVYRYLKEIAGVSPQKAAAIAEACANKDHEKPYYHFKVDEQGHLSTLEGERPAKKNIYQKIIHDADCLDIIRVRPVFDAKYLDFYQDHVKENNDETALNQMAEMITDARTLIEIQGDGYRQSLTYDSKTKIRYEQNENCYLATLDDLKSTRLMKSLYHLNAKEEISENSSQQEQDPMTTAMNEGQLFVRGITLPSSQITKKTKSNTIETSADIELRKIDRQKGVKTTTSKHDGLQKSGLPLRSCSMIGWGAATFSDAGFIIRPPLSQIKQISATDCDSGYGKKKHLNLVTISDATKRDSLMQLQKGMKMGGELRRFDGSTLSSHNELLIDIHTKDICAIFYTQDPNLNNQFTHQNSYPFHKNAPLLKAIYLKNAYLKKHQESLPIYLYSGRKNIIQEVNTSEKELLNLWETMIRDYLEAQFSSSNMGKLPNQFTVDEIKVLATYGTLYAHNKNLTSCDNNYPEDLKQAISDITKKWLQSEYVRYKSQLVEEIKTDPNLLFRDNIYLQVISDDIMLTELKEIIMSQVDSCIKLPEEIEPHSYVYGSIVNMLDKEKQEINIEKTPSVKLIQFHNLLETLVDKNILQVDGETLAKTKASCLSFIKQSGEAMKSRVLSPDYPDKTKMCLSASSLLYYLKNTVFLHKSINDCGSLRDKIGTIINQYLDDYILPYIEKYPFNNELLIELLHTVSFFKLGEIQQSLNTVLLTLAEDPKHGILSVKTMTAILQAYRASGLSREQQSESIKQHLLGSKDFDTGYDSQAFLTTELIQSLGEFGLLNDLTVLKKCTQALSSLVQTGYGYRTLQLAQFETKIEAIVKTIYPEKIDGFKRIIADIINKDFNELLDGIRPTKEPTFFSKTACKSFGYGKENIENLIKLSEYILNKKSSNPHLKLDGQMLRECKRCLGSLSTSNATEKTKCTALKSKLDHCLQQVEPMVKPSCSIM